MSFKYELCGKDFQKIQFVIRQTDGHALTDWFDPSVITTGGATDRPGGGSVESSPYFTRRHHGHHSPLERYQSCMTLPSEGLVEALEHMRDRASAEGDERGAGTGSSGPASPRSVNSAPCGLEDHSVGPSRLGLALPLGLAHSSPTASPQRMEWKVRGVLVLKSHLWHDSKLTGCKNNKPNIQKTSCLLNVLLR